MKLSILICTLYDRASDLNKLMNVLQPQVVKDVEILTELDGGELSTGAKRNKLLKRARGDYVAFIDDDDLVSTDYVSKLLKAIDTNPDCCSLQGQISMTERIKGRSRRKRKRVNKIFIHSLRYDSWFEKDRVYYRCPNHLNAIKRSIALQVMFVEVDRGEDRTFSEMIYPLLNTEEWVQGTIFFYFAS